MDKAKATALPVLSSCQDGLLSLKGNFMPESRWLPNCSVILRLAFTAFPVTLMVIPSIAARANEPNASEIEAGFVKLDQDKSGALDETEFSLAKERIRGELKSHFIGLVRFDRMGESAMPRLFARLDSDGDGKLNKNEFRNLRGSLTDLLKSRNGK